MYYKLDTRPLPATARVWLRQTS